MPPPPLPVSKNLLARVNCSLIDSTNKPTGWGCGVKVSPEWSLPPFSSTNSISWPAAWTSRRDWGRCPLSRTLIKASVRVSAKTLGFNQIFNEFRKEKRRLSQRLLGEIFKFCDKPEETTGWKRERKMNLEKKHRKVSLLSVSASGWRRKRTVRSGDDISGPDISSIGQYFFFVVGSLPPPERLGGQGNNWKDEKIFFRPEKARTEPFSWAIPFLSPVGSISGSWVFLSRSKMCALTWAISLLAPTSVAVFGTWPVAVCYSERHPAGSHVHKSAELFGKR